MRRRRRQPELHGAAARLARRLRRLVPAHADALALPRVRGRPRRGDHHRPPERARLGAAEDLQRHAPDPAEGPARGRRAAGVLHLPGRAGARSPACSPRTRRWRSGSRRCSGWRRSSRARSPRSRGLPRHPPRQARAQAARARPAVRDVDGLREDGDGAQPAQHRQGGDRLPAARDRRLRRDREGHGGGRARHRLETRARRRRAPTTSTATAG